MDGRGDAGEVMSFHALFLALVTPPLAAILVLVVFGARPLGLPLVVATLAPAYFVGFAPAFLAGRLDQALAKMAVAFAVGAGDVSGAEPRGCRGLRTAFRASAAEAQASVGGESLMSCVWSWRP